MELSWIFYQDSTQASVWLGLSYSAASSESLLAITKLQSSLQ